MSTAFELMDVDDIAFGTGAARSTVRGWRRGRAPAPRFARRLARLQEVVAALLERSPTINVGLWLTGKNPYLNENRPGQMIAEDSDEPDGGWWDHDSPYGPLTSNVLEAAKATPEGSISLTQALIEGEQRRKGRR